MAFNRYTLKKNKRTEEAHLYFSELSGNNCRVRQGSVCGLMDLEEGDETIFLCLTKEEARKRIAEMGEEVCGNCAGHLHADETN